MVMARGLPSPGAMEDMEATEEDTEATEEDTEATGAALATAGANGLLMPRLWLCLRLSPDTDMEVMADMVAMDMLVTEDMDMARDLLNPDMAMDMEDMVAMDMEGMVVTGTMVNCTQEPPPLQNMLATKKMQLQPHLPYIKTSILQRTNVCLFVFKFTKCNKL